MYQEELYEPNDIDNELFLSAVPLELLEDAIRSQFNDPSEYRKSDYVQGFLNKYEFSVQNIHEDDQEELEELHESFITFMKDIIEAYLNVGIPNILDQPENEQHKLIHYTYRFFIVNIKKNFVSLVWNFINNRKDQILPIMEKKKDVVYLNFKAELPDEYDILLLSNLSTVISYILSLEYTIDDFFQLCDPSGSYLESAFVQKAFDEYSLTGNFVPNYISMVDSLMYNDIENKIRNKILKKYPLRKNKTDSDTEEAEEETRNLADIDDDNE